MRYNKIIVALIVVIAMCLPSCQKGSIFGIRGEGGQVTETRDLKDFNAIRLSIDANVLYTQDSVFKVEITAQKNILAVMNLTNESGELHIDFKRNVYKHQNISVVVHSPDLNKLTVSGSGNITTAGNLATTHLDLGISGSGDITIPAADLQSITAHISGSGNIRLDNGTCKSETFEISGSGNINTEFLSALNGDAKISGSGGIIINASETLRVRISGSGDVKYKGTPSISNQISGSGKLIHLY